jgi:hypothetical protein
MSRTVRNRMIVVLALLVALVALGLPAIASASVASGGGEVAVSATETVAVTDLPVAGHGERESSDAAGIALHHTVMTVLVLLAAAAMALGAIGLLWRYQRR